MAPVRLRRHQRFDRQAGQLAGLVAEQLVELRVGHDDQAVHIDYQHAVRRSLDDAAIPGLGGFQHHLLRFEFDRHGLHRVAACLDFQRHRQFGQQLVHQHPARFAGSVEAGQLQHAHQALAVQQWQHLQVAWARPPQLRVNLHVVVRQGVEPERLAVLRALTQQATAQRQLRRRRMVRIGGVAGGKAQCGGVFVKQVERALASLHQRRE
ncbi:hypothetical protein D3C72_992080 [compost metagenome]